VINLKSATAFGLTILKPLVRAEELVEKLTRNLDSKIPLPGFDHFKL
jgi:hypothetical protein